MQKLFPNIIISGLINGVSQFATIPFLHTLNTTVSRRKGLMAMFALTSLFTFVQYILDPSGCVNCSGQVVSVLMLAFFFGARFFTNICSNFYINTLNETFPAQIRPIAYCSVVGVGRLSSLVIPFVPVISQHLNLGYNVIFGVVGLLGIGGSYMLRETINVPPPEIIEELRDEKQMDLRRCLYEDKLEDWDCFHKNSMRHMIFQWFYTYKNNMKYDILSINHSLGSIVILRFLFFFLIQKPFPQSFFDSWQLFSLLLHILLILLHYSSHNRCIFYMLTFSEVSHKVTFFFGIFLFTGRVLLMYFILFFVGFGVDVLPHLIKCIFFFHHCILYQLCSNFPVIMSHNSDQRQSQSYHNKSFQNKQHKYLSIVIQIHHST